MPVARHARRPRLNSTPRGAVDASLQPRIDAALKATRACAQRLAPLETCLQDEMRVLERLYYKGVNQHRMALFWRRVEEMRRLGRRVLEVQLVGMTDDLRYAFYVGEEAERNPKILRNAWSQVPDAKFLNFMYERSRGLIELVTTAKERIVKAYHSLSLMMQTGAFLQLILILTAIVSRLHAVTGELETTLQSLSSTLYTLYTLLEALGHKKLKPKGRNAVQQSAQKRPRLETREDVVMEESMGEDLGSSVVRKTVVETAVASGTTADAPFPTDSFSSFWQQNEQIITVDQEPSSEAPSLIVSTAAVAEEFASSAIVSKKAKPKTGSSEPKKAKEKKEKKRKDEIDDIFGSL